MEHGQLPFFGQQDMLIQLLEIFTKQFLLLAGKGGDQTLKFTKLRFFLAILLLGRFGDSLFLLSRFFLGRFLGRAFLFYPLFGYQLFFSLFLFDQFTSVFFVFSLFCAHCGSP